MYNRKMLINKKRKRKRKHTGSFKLVGSTYQASTHASLRPSFPCVCHAWTRHCPFSSPKCMCSGQVWKNEAYEYVRAEKGDGQVRVGRLPNKPRLRPGRAGAKPCLTAPARPVVWASQSRLLPGQSRGFGAKPGRKSTTSEAGNPFQ
jgi:hypothetical protein